MDWFEPVDLYCERIAPGIAGEPFNVLSNLGFFLAAWFVWRAVRRVGRWPASADLHGVWLLIVLVGFGSVAFHVFAVRWVGLLDVLVIALYLHYYVAVFLARPLGMRWSLAWIGMPAFFVFAHGVDRISGAAISDPMLRGTIGYLPALAGISALAAWLRWRRDPRWAWLGVAAALLVAALGVRQLDLPLCARWPLGTHGAWHLLTATVLWLSVQALLPRAGRYASKP